MNEVCQFWALWVAKFAVSSCLYGEEKIETRCDKQIICANEKALRKSYDEGEKSSTDDFDCQR
jgi:hypothetical protein